MKEKISRLSRGIVEQESPRLELNETSIRENIISGGIHRGDFRIYSGNQLAFRGLVYSSDPRVTLEQGYFTGQSPVLNYEVNALHLEEGDVIDGAFSLVTNGGEATIPYRFTARFGTGLEREEIKTAEQFAALVREESDYALRLFESADFVKLPFMQDLVARGLYDGLRVGVGRRNALEEFLTSLQLKETVQLTTDVTERFHDGCPMQAERVLVSRNTWGYVAAAVKADAAFIYLEKDALTEADFVGNDCIFSYRIDRSKLHRGRNFGRIRIETLRQILEIPVTVVMGEAGSTASRSKQKYEKHLVRFMRSYLDLQANHYEKNLLLNTLQWEWDSMAKLREPDIRMRLWEIEIAQAWGRKELAGRLLNDVQVDVQKQRQDDPDAYCYFLYLQMLQIDSWELKERLLKLLHRFRSDGQASATVWLLQLKVDESMADQPMETLSKMREFYEQGCRSPYLFLEGCKIYNRIPETLQELGAFEQQMIWFGAKHGYLSEAVARRIANLSLRERGYQPLLYRLLVALYAAYPLEDLLLAICAVLIRGDQRGNEYFSWYQKGVEADVRLTKLYDYYLYSMPDDYEGELPQALLLYYSYNSPGGLRSQSLLYDYILSHYPAESQMYQAYEPQMGKYAVDQLLAGHVDEYLARLYRQMIYPEMVDERVARILPDVLFTRQVSVELPGICQVIAVYGELKEELAVPVRRGVAYLPVYTDYCRLLFADVQGNRYSRIPHKVTPLMPDSAELLAQCRRVYSAHPMLRLSACNDCLQSEQMSEDRMEMIREMAEVAEIHPLYQKKLISAMVHYYTDEEHGDGEALLSCMENPYLSRNDRIELIEALIARNYLEEALRQVRKYGYGRIRPRCLLKLCSRMILAKHYAEDDFLIRLGFDLFTRGQYDETILSYLCVHYNGRSKEMYELLRRAESQGADTGDMAERLLGQMLFTGYHEEMDAVFHCYASQGPVEKLLINAYFVVKCHSYFLFGEAVEASVFDHVRQVVQKDLLAGNVPVICQLALTKYMSGLPSLSGEEQVLCQEMVNRLYHKGLLFPYMKKLGRFVRLPDELCDKTLIEYRGEESDQVEISLRILTDGEEAETVRMEMPHVYLGIFVKPVLLFADDKLEYEVIVTRGEKHRVAAKDVIDADITSPVSSNRFRRLNRLVAGSGDADTDGWQEEMLEYSICDTLVGKLFTAL